MQTRGSVGSDEVEAFFAAGYGKQQALEVILGISHKLMSNFTNHVGNTPLDQPFQKDAWEKPSTEAAA